MADTKISDLTAVTTVDSTMELPVNESGTSKKLTVEQLENYVITVNEGLIICLARAQYLM